MAVGIVDRQKLVDIADAVRAKRGITGDMTLDAIASNITSIPTADNNAKFDFSESGSKSRGDLPGYLTTVDLSNFDTSDYTHMGSMFNSYYSLTALDASNFNTSKVTYMGAMFNNCEALTTLNLSNFDTSKVTYMNNMFNNCKKLSNLTLGNDWASNSSISSFSLSHCPLTHESAIDVINKLATRSNSPVITFSNDVGLYQSEIDVATNKGWSVSGCNLIIEDATTATVGQYTFIDGVFSKCAYVADTAQSWGQRVFIAVSSFTDSNGNSTFEWGGYGTYTGRTATDIGTGLSNTNSLIARNLQSTDGTPTIWDAIKEFRSTYGDSWFVPSQSEFNIKPSNSAWSSSEYTETSSINRSADGYNYSNNKNNKFGLNPAIYV